jgi:carboxyvinyl-carboxyphosphonate phosphorylmutase
MKAALAGRQDPSLVVAGRTSAAQIAGVDEAIRRTNAYAEVGVDAMFLAGVNSRADLEAIHAATDIPLIAGGSGELADREYLAANGVRVALQGHLSFQASVKAVYDTLKALRDGVAPADLRPTLASSELMNQVTRQADYSRWTEEFLK